MAGELAAWMAEQGATHLWVVYTDYHGRMAGRDVPRDRVSNVEERGTNFAKANFNFTLRDEQVPDPYFGADSGDVLAVPDAESLVRIPYQPDSALAFATLLEEKGQIWQGCPRAALKRVVAALAEAGLRARVAFEPEFYLFSDSSGDPISRAGMYTIDGLNDGMEFVRRLADALPSMGVELEQIGKEYGQGQYEANIAPDSPVQAAEDLFLLRLAIRGIAKQLGQHATFMPKMSPDVAGSGLHVHLSLQDVNDDQDRTAGSDQASGLSDTARCFMAGWLKHAESLTALGAPTPNSYKRLQPASWAPAHICWGIGNRAALVRVPGPGKRARLEFRAGDNTSNPFLFLAGLIWAGLDGIKQGLQPGEPMTADVGHLSADDVAERGLRFLPRDAGPAFDALEQDDVLRDGLGSLLHTEFLRVKRHELATYNLQVSDWERATYFDAP
jgi:glutamine synthetase